MTSVVWPRIIKTDQGLVTEIPDWRAFLEITARLGEVGAPHQRNYFCRGQDRDWPLRPSLLRPAKQAGLDAGNVLELEQALLPEFRARAHAHLPESLIPPVAHELVNWWTLMQHYGAPTRLLDWTASPFVAAYFAVVEGALALTPSKEPGVVWIVQAGRLTELTAKSGPDLPNDVDETGRLLWDPSAAPRLHFVERRLLTDRMVAQQTYFSMSAQVLADHDDLISRAIAPELARQEAGTLVDLLVLKLLIPAERKAEFLGRLRAMNIAASALFPGIDGLGRSMAELARLTASHLATNGSGATTGAE